jgi:hypothetical protein
LLLCKEAKSVKGGSVDQGYRSNPMGLLSIAGKWLPLNAFSVSCSHPNHRLFQSRSGRKLAPSDQSDNISQRVLI